MHLVPKNLETDLLAKVGIGIKQLRIKKNISLSDFRKSIKLTVSEVKRLEDGEIDLDLLLFYSITEALDISPSRFFEITESLL